MCIIIMCIILVLRSNGTSTETGALAEETSILCEGELFCIYCCFIAIVVTCIAMAKKLLESGSSCISDANSIYTELKYKQKSKLRSQKVSMLRESVFQIAVHERK